MQRGDSRSEDFRRLKIRIVEMEEEIKGELRVKDVMTPNVVTVGNDISILETVRLMEEHDISCVVVLDGKEPVGMITERDIVRKVVLRGLDTDKCVEEIMSRPLILTRGDTKLKVATIGMERHKVRRLPVIEDEKLLGILTVTDILKTPPSYASLF